ncbi:MAG: uroporphyrinogen decarboxylase family protein [Bacillota bacterium]
MKLKTEIVDLLKQYLDIVNSERNQQNKKYWAVAREWNRDMWRGTPKPNKEAVPFLVALDNSLWANVLQVDLRDYYNDPETYLQTQLRAKIYHFNNFKDNTYFTDELFIWFGVITELSYLETPITFFPHKEAWIDRNIFRDGIGSLKEPDFFKSGLMPRIHQFYEVFNEYSRGQLKVMFPDWVRGPFCIACHLRGMDNFLMDMLTDPDGAYRLLRSIVDCNKKWNRDRAAYLGESENKGCKLFNDEISCPTLSPALYRDFILPYEKELAECYGGVRYWHSCGDTTNLLEAIAELPNLQMFHCGPWTSYEKAARVFGPKGNVALDVDLNPTLDIIEADKEIMVQKLSDIKEKCRNVPLTIRADGFMPNGSPEYILTKIKKWVDAGNLVLGA